MNYVSDIHVIDIMSALPLHPVYFGARIRMCFVSLSKVVKNHFLHIQWYNEFSPGLEVGTYTQFYMECGTGEGFGFLRTSAAVFRIKSNPQPS